MSKKHVMGNPKLLTSDFLKEKAKKYFIDEDAVGHRDIIEGKEPLKKPLTGKTPKEKVEAILHEHKKGKLHIGSSDKKVPKGKKGKDQAVAIAMDEAGLNKIKELKKNWELIKAKIISHENNFQNIAKQPLKDPEISSNDVDPKELQMGIEDEMEHTDDEDTAKKIALHHLQKDPAYYSKLKQGIVPNEGDSEQNNPEEQKQPEASTTEAPAGNPDTTSENNKEETYHEDEDLNSIAKELIASGIPRDQIDAILNPPQAETATPTTEATTTSSSAQPEKTIDEELEEIGKQVKLKELKLKSRQLDSELAGNGEQPAKQPNPKL